jgi:type I restriction enzyme S subunit
MPLNKTMENKKNRLIPNLRFPEFVNVGEWEEKAIGEFTPLQRGFDLPVDNIIQGKYPVVFSNGILKYHNQYKVKAPGVVTGRSGTIGKVTYVEKDFWPHNTSLWVTDFFNNSPLFVYYYFVLIGLEQFGTGSGVPTLNRNDVHRHKILVPSSTQEQQKIASCLSSLDEVIAAHSQKLDLLKEHKKGLMQNLFPKEGETVPKWRFSEFEKDGGWKKTKLIEHLDLLSGFAFQSIFFSETGKKLVTPKKFHKKRCG